MPDCERGAVSKVGHDLFEERRACSKNEIAVKSESKKAKTDCPEKQATSDLLDFLGKQLHTNPIAGQMLWSRQGNGDTKRVRQRKT